MWEFFVVFGAVVTVIGSVALVAFVYKPKKNISGKIALVTGGGNGLGQQISLKLAGVGCHVAIADIDFASAEKTANTLIQLGVKSKAYKIDVTDSEAVEAIKNSVEADLGKVDILVNNAGIIPYKSIFDQTAAELDRLTRVNFTSVMIISKLFLKSMIESGTGHIVTIASLQGIYAYPHSVTYCATKFGVTGFMLSLMEFLRLEKLDRKINVTTILPDVIATRDDIINKVNSKLLTADYVAKQVVDAIQRNKAFVSVPSYLGFGISFFNMLPFRVQHFIRDHLRMESTFLVK